MIALMHRGDNMDIKIEDVLDLEVALVDNCGCANGGDKC